MFLLLLFIWFIFNGKVTLEITWIGIVLCAAIYFFMCRFMDYSIKKDLHFLRKSGTFLYYIGMLILEIIKSSLQVIHLILTDREIVEPVIVKHKTPLKTRSGRVLLANSITLTPGTFTIILEEDELIIHCLDEEMAEGIDDLKLEKLLLKLENIIDTGTIQEK